MAYRFFASATRRRLLAGGSTLGAAGLAGSQLSSPNSGNGDLTATEAEIQFHTSYGFVNNGQQLVKPPEGWTGRVFQIRNDYPKLGGPVATITGLPTLPGPDQPLPVLKPEDDAPWLKVDFLKDPLTYCSVIKEYCWAGNVNNDFVLQDNHIRPWYHAPWMHWSVNGREPLNGLTFERPTPPGELASAQTRTLQTWACGFYNAAGATAFAQIWDDPNCPLWEKFKFPVGTCVFKILMTDAKDDEVFSMKGAPGMKAVVAPQDADSGAVRQDKASDLRLLQVDFAVRDDRAPIGWVFGTFMYDGRQKERKAWDRVIPVGIMWGNDPQLWPADAARGESPKESWINPVAEELRLKLNGKRPSWGWNRRMNGPADNFVSACASCHSTSQRDKEVPMVLSESWTDAHKMELFQNIPAGEPYSKDDVSGDYSLQLMMGYHNFLAWQNSQKGLWYKTKLLVPFSKARQEAATIEAKRAPLRTGPEPDYEKYNK